MTADEVKGAAPDAGPRRVLTAGHAWTAAIVVALVGAVVAFGGSEGTRSRRVVREPGEVPAITLTVRAARQELAAILLPTARIGAGDPEPDPVAVLALDELDSRACDEVLAAGRLVIMATLDTADRELRSCLVDGGGVVVAFDALGDLLPARPGAGEVVSTRRGYVDNLLDLARWASEQGQVGPSVGFVGLGRDAEVVDDAVAALEAEGVPVSATALVGEGGADLAGAVAGFVDEEVDTVVLSLPADLTGEWAVAHRAVDPRVRILSGDAYDLVIREDHPAALDGAVVVTSRIGPWATRDRANVDRRRCDDRFVAAGGTDPARLDHEARTALYALCQHLDLVDAAVAGVERGATISDALRSQTVRSPLTSFLQGTTTGAFGPSQDAVLRWSSGCGCFEVERPFAAR